MDRSTGLRKARLDAQIEILEKAIEFGRQSCYENCEYMLTQKKEKLSKLINSQQELARERLLEAKLVNDDLG